MNNGKGEDQDPVVEKDDEEFSPFKERLTPTGQVPQAGEEEDGEERTITVSKYHLDKLLDPLPEKQREGWLKKIWRYTPKVIGTTWNVTTIPYSIYVALLYASFASEHGKGDTGLEAFYASSSFLQNVFSAMVFNFTLGDQVESLKNYKENNIFLTSSIGGGFILAFATTGAGFKVALDSSGESPLEFLHMLLFAIPAVVAFLLNTFTTRGSVGVQLTYNIVIGTRRLYCLNYPLDHPRKPYFQLLDDMELRYAQLKAIGFNIDNFNNGTFKKDSGASAVELNLQLQRFVRGYYNGLKRHHLTLEGWKEWGKWLGLKLIDLSLLTFVQSMDAVWLKLTQNGVNDLQKLITHTENPTWGNHFILTALLGFSNVLFYSRSGLNYRDAMYRLITTPYVAIQKSNEHPCKKVILMGVTTGGLIIFFVTAYASGAGYAQEQQKLSDDPDPPSCASAFMNFIFFSWFYHSDFITKILPNIASVCAGSIANGRGTALAFLGEWPRKSLTRLFLSSRSTRGSLLEESNVIVYDDNSPTEETRKAIVKIIDQAANTVRDKNLSPIVCPANSRSYKKIEDEEDEIDEERPEEPPVLVEKQEGTSYQVTAEETEEQEITTVQDIAKIISEERAKWLKWQKNKDRGFKKSEEDAADGDYSDGFVDRAEERDEEDADEEENGYKAENPGFFSRCVSMCVVS